MVAVDSPGHLWPLVEALQRLPCLAEQNDRNMVVRLLNYQLGPLQVEEHSRAVWHLLSIVEVCSRHPDGLTTLLEVVAMLDQDSIYMSDVRRIVSQMTALPIWSAEERDQLFTLLSGMIVSDFVDLYWQVAGTGAPDLPAPVTYREAFLTLETLNANPDGLPKPLVFLEYLAGRVRPELGIELRRWADRQAHKLVLSTQLQALRRTVRTPPPGPRTNSPAYLVVQLQYEGVSGDYYRLSHWRQLDLTAGWHPERGTDFVGSLDETKRRLAELIEDVEASWARYQPDIRLEVVLPSELLNLDVDQWPWEVTSELPEPVGCRYAVVVRSLERMQTRHWHRAWHVRWQVLNAQSNGGETVAPESVCWGESRKERALRALVADFENDTRLVSLALSEPPHPATRGRAETAVALRAGVPIILWHREDCGSDEFMSAVREVLHGKDPESILQRTRQLRTNAFAEEGEHAVRHLSLLWDDPERLVVPVDAGPPEGVTAA